MQRIIYFDIDDTLVRSYGQKRIPMPAVIAQIRRLKAEGVTLYLWSSGGSEYCKSTALELGIVECFDGFLPKPTVYVDDQPVHEWKLCKHLYPSQADNAEPYAQVRSLWSLGRAFGAPLSCTLGHTTMTNLVPERHAPKEIEGPLISTGMGRGLHAWIATALTIAAVVLGFAAQAFTSPVLALLSLAAATGLLGEVPRLLASGEVRARAYSDSNPRKVNKFLVIRRDDSPIRFYFYVVTYIVLGGFALLWACAILVSIFIHYVS